ETELGLAEDRARSRAEVVAVDRRRTAEALERVERLVVAPLAQESVDRGEPRQLDRPLRLARGIEDLDPRRGVVEVETDEPGADRAGGLERVGTLRDHLAPLRPIGVADVDRDHPAARRGEVGLEEEG